MRSHKPTPEGRIYEEFEFDIGRSHLVVEAMFECPEGEKKSIPVGNGGGKKKANKVVEAEQMQEKKSKLSYEDDPDWEE